MKKIRVSIFLLLSIPFIISIGIAAEDIKVVVRNIDATLNYQIIDDGKLLVSVLDKNDDPVRGLTAENFIIGSGFRKAEVLSATSLETTEAVPLNIVLVVDNSFSMRERRAVNPLLKAMDEFFKTVRPIDNIHLVVFDDYPTLKVGPHRLHAKTFHSSDISRLRDFLKVSLEQNSTGKTYLYEAMAAGVDIIRAMPAKDQKFIVVFSDGEDLNSSLSTGFIEEQARDIDNFEAFCVDYMPGAKLNRFLTSFARTNGGRIWKATSASELLPIFQAFTTTLRYRYVVSYRLLNSINVEPGELNFEMLTRVDGSPLPSFLFFETGQSEISSDYVLLKNPEDALAFDASSLTTAMDRYRNILNLVGQHLVQNSEAVVKIVGCNSDSGIEKDNLDLSGRRAGQVIAYLQDIWGINATRIELETRNLPADPTPPEVVGAGLENQRVEIVYDSTGMQTVSPDGFLVETSGHRELKVETNIFSASGLSTWDLIFYNDDQPLKRVSGEGEIAMPHTFAWSELDVAGLPRMNNLGIQLQATARSGASIETGKVMLPVTISLTKWDDKLVRAPQISLTLEPQTVTIEELTTIDSSPFLNYIYFDTADSEIPARYATLESQRDTQSFDESRLEGTLEKHYNVLNILGRRLAQHGDARIRIVGCNSNRGEERGKTDLSRSRAEAVRAYLKYIWGIDASRMEIEARNQPEVASSSGSAEGRRENQRVEIYSESPALLDVVKSTYVQEICDTENFLIQPRVNSAYELDRWTIKLNGDGNPIESLSGAGHMEPAYHLSLTDVGLGKLSAYRTVTAGIEVIDRKGQTASANADAEVRFIKRKERSAQKEGYRVLEKYALILFDFNRAEIREKNRDVIDRIVDRIREVPTATVSIVGHTDIIGQEAYNLDLSSRRAKAAYDMILAGGVAEGDNISYKGIGPHDALFDNALPEGRALNRTVTVTLEYEQN